MKLEDHNTLEDYFFTIPIYNFPKKINLHHRYKLIRDTLKKHVHKYVDEGSTEIDGSSDYTMTGHDYEHVNQVIQVATDMVCATDFELSPYEIYLLLTAIQLHDIGNILGREKHEKAHEEVFHDLFPFNKFGELDNIESNIYLSIAKSHGGVTNSGNKDTITEYNPKPKIAHNNERGIRVQLLAAILRLADEFAENPERAKNYLLAKKRFNPKSEIFHIYASCITNSVVTAKQKRLDITYSITEDQVKKKFIKGDSEEFLIDEIFNRNKKLHTERVYCNKFLVPEIQIIDIEVEIVIYSEGFKRELHRINFEMIDRGYPNIADLNLKDICRDPQDIVSPNGEVWNGELLIKYLNTL